MFLDFAMFSGGSSTKLKGGGVGNLERGRQKHNETRRILGLFPRKFTVFLLNNALVNVIPHIPNEILKERVHLVQDKGYCSCQKGAPKLSFHHEGGQLPPFAP